MITRAIIVIFMIECIMCAVAATWATIWNKMETESTDLYMVWPDHKLEKWAWYTYI